VSIFLLQKVPCQLTKVASIVFVHGLQGHPHRTWTNTKSSKTLKRALSIHARTPKEEKPPEKRLRSWISKVSRRRRKTEIAPTVEPSLGTAPANDAPENPSRSPVFWPADLLPALCPRARVLMYGYDTKVTNYMASPTNKNSIYSHAKDLLFALSRETDFGRPLVFVAHSLGGIVVKEVCVPCSSAS
jgi:predicted alpha/beta hydrolase family esterase